MAYPTIADQRKAPHALHARRPSFGKGSVALGRLLTVLAGASGLGYLTWRCVATIDMRFWWLAIPMWLLELHATATLLLFAFSAWDTEATPPAATVSQPPGQVAVLIPTYNEPVEVLLPTVTAAVAMRIDHETWILDDGDREWVRDLADSLGARYFSRTVKHHAKAGNINAALEVVQADFITIFDADHVASPAFLERTLGYFNDPEIGLVQTPQDFYNVHSFEHVGRRVGKGAENASRLYCEQSVFYRVLQPGRNKWNAAFWCGTNAVVRVGALEQIGGLATESVTEDILTTIRLHRRGWNTVYHNEVLAHGLAAADGSQYLTQRIRWGTGAMQVLRRENPITERTLTLPQRLCYAATLTGWFDAWRTLGYVLLPMAVLFTGASPIRSQLPVFLAVFIPTLLLQQAALTALSRGYASVGRALLFEFIRLPANLAATLTLFNSREIDFRVTDKGRQGDQRDRVAVPRVLGGLMVLSLVAAVWFGVCVAGLGPVTYRTPGIAYVSAAWLVFNAVLIAVAIRRIRSQRFASERRASVRFEVAADAAFDADDVVLMDLSLTGARLRMARPVRVRHGVLQINHDGQSISVAADVVRSWRSGDADVVTLRFSPGQTAAQAQLSFALFGRADSATLMRAGGLVARVGDQHAVSEGAVPRARSAMDDLPLDGPRVPTVR